MIRTPSLRVNSFLQKNLSRSGYQSPFTRDACTKMSALALSCAAERCYLKRLHPGFLRRKVAKWKKARPELFPDSAARAREVLPGENWTFPDHRTLAEVIEAERNSPRVVSKAS